MKFMRVWAGLVLALVACSAAFSEQGRGPWAEDGKPIALGHREGLGIEIKPSAAGLDVTADGTKLLVADRYNDSVTLVDPMARLVTGELDLRPGAIDPRKHGVPGGEYPDWVAIK
jgi:hypothetical protein